jgi:hypothetical protein
VKKKTSIALITCYFGELPWYFDYFVHSCKYNADIDFYIITNDINYQRALPVNVKLIFKTINDINKIATQKLGFDVNISHGYKMCDFKPAYGLLFSEILVQYDFWGYCDIDIIFGNIRNFITEDILNEHDLISVRHDWIPGCFLLVKNTEPLINLFKHSKDYKKVFQSNEHFCFDETNFAHDEFTKGNAYHAIKTEIESMMHVVKRLENQKYITPFFDHFIIEGLPGKIIWENGKMTYKKEFEVLLYHLIYLKKIFRPSLPGFNISDSFSITSKKIKNLKPLLRNQ